jgi:hypothetical protein
MQNPGMTTYYTDYSWKNGKPVGKGACTTLPSEGVFFKIVADPYFKHISVERYENNRWHSVIYDSSCLDFRKLNERDQRAWHNETLNESTDFLDCLIRDQDDRVVYIEKHEFKKNIPVECRIFSPHGNLLATQKMHYKEWGAPFNGVTLSDSMGRLVLKKTYDFDPHTFEFTDLIAEEHGEK